MSDNISMGLCFTVSGIGGFVIAFSFYPNLVTSIGGAILWGFLVGIAWPMVFPRRGY